MQRGDVYLIDLGPARPAVLVSNNAANRMATRSGRGVVTVVPVTSNTARIHPFQVAIAAGEGGLAADSKAQAEQVRSVDFGRLRQRLGALRAPTLRRLDDALRIHLGL